MRVVLSKDVKGLGAVGDVKEVADGYARNYLIPRALAVAATKSALTEVEARRASEAKRQLRVDLEAREIASRLEAQPIVIRAKVGEHQRLYGSVTSADVAEQIGQVLGAPFDKRKVDLPEPIKSVGSHPVSVQISRGVAARLTVEVQAENGG